MPCKDFNQKEILTMIAKLKNGSEFDYESGSYFNNDSLMEEAAEVIKWLYTRHDFNKANRKDNRAYF